MSCLAAPSTWGSTPVLPSTGCWRLLIKAQVSGQVWQTLSELTYNANIDSQLLSRCKGFLTHELSHKLDRRWVMRLRVIMSSETPLISKALIPFPVFEEITLSTKAISWSTSKETAAFSRRCRLRPLAGQHQKR